MLILIAIVQSAAVITTKHYDKTFLQRCRNVLGSLAYYATCYINTEEADLLQPIGVPQCKLVILYIFTNVILCNNNGSQYIYNVSITILYHYGRGYCYA